MLVDVPRSRMSPGCSISSENFGALRKGSGVRELQIQAPSLEGALKPFLYFIYHSVITSDAKSQLLLLGVLHTLSTRPGSGSRAAPEGGNSATTCCAQLMLSINPEHVPEMPRPHLN